MLAGRSPENLVSKGTKMYRANPFPPGLASDKWHQETSADVIGACKTALYLKLLCFFFLICGVTQYFHVFYIFKNTLMFLQLLENGKKVVDI